MSTRFEAMNQPWQHLSADVSTADFVSQIGNPPLPATRNWQAQVRYDRQLTNPSAVLQGWKAIAVFLDRGVRTLQRWERTLGLPVHRIGSCSRGPVIAFRDELDWWLKEVCLPGDSFSNKEKQGRYVPQVGSSGTDIVNIRNPGPRRRAKAETEGRENRSNGGTCVPQLIVVPRSSKCCPELKKRKCESCHSPLQLVDAVLSVASLTLYRKVVLCVCPICDVDLTGVQKLEKCS